MRRALVSVVVGLAGAAALAAAAWAVQTVALPQPARAHRVAADVGQWFHYYRLSIDVFHSDGHRFSGECLRGSYRIRGPRHVRHAHGSVLALSGGPVVLLTGKRRIRLVSGRRRSELPAFLAVAAGCTKALASEVDAAAQSNLRLRVERAYAANQPALALRLPRIRDERLTIYLSPRNDRPLVAVAAVGGRIATARLYLTRATTGRKARIRALLQRNPRFRA